MKQITDYIESIKDNLLPYEMELIQHFTAPLYVWGEDSETKWSRFCVRIKEVFGVDIKGGETFDAPEYWEEGTYKSIEDYVSDDWHNANWYYKPEKFDSVLDAAYGIRQEINNGSMIVEGLTAWKYYEEWNRLCDENENPEMKIVRTVKKLQDSVVRYQVGEWILTIIDDGETYELFINHSGYGVMYSCFGLVKDNGTENGLSMIEFLQIALDEYEDYAEHYAREYME